jgi:hypothetical protein
MPPSERCSAAAVLRRMLPLMRIVGKGRVPPEKLNMMMLGTIGLALSHAGYIMFSDSTVLIKEETR